MNTPVKIILIIVIVIIVVLILMFFLGRKRLKEQESTDIKLERLIQEGKYAAAKCIIQSDVIYHDRVALGSEQKKHLQYLDGLVKQCDDKMIQMNIDETAELGDYIISIIPDIDIVQFGFILKYCNPDLNYQNDTGLTFLMAACSHKRLQIVEQLIDRKADVNKTGNDGKTALIIACNTGNYTLVKLLIERGADVRHRDREGKTMIEQVNTDSDDYTKILSLLVESGAETRK
ncbi:MAG TPA: ankyrin repeat domain-containing protein [Spirochaetota bacterium]|nr:ankyrin repeat domain-containing protein [Spirochaetota bacterium]